MTKVSFNTYTPLKNGNRSLDEAISEVQREMDVRKRLFDKWVSDGRMSWVDAHDRLERQCTALKMLIHYSNALAAEAKQDENLTSTPLKESSVICLDDAVSAEAS